MENNPKARLLVVDDNPYVLKLVCKMLSVLGFQTSAAEDGLAALERFEGDAFDLVLTDLKMPRMDGWDLARQIKSLAPEVPVIALTGESETEVMERLMGSGVDHALFKPLDIEHLNTVVTKALESRLIRTMQSDAPGIYEACAG